MRKLTLYFAAFALLLGLPVPTLAQAIYSPPVSPVLSPADTSGLRQALYASLPSPAGKLAISGQTPTVTLSAAAAGPSLGGGAVTYYAAYGGTTGGGTTQPLTATATVSGGAVTALNLSNGQAGYTLPPTFTFSGGGGSGAAATANVTAGAVSGYTITSGGAGYTSAPTVTVILTPDYTHFAYSNGSVYGFEAVPAGSPIYVPGVQNANDSQPNAYHNVVVSTTTDAPNLDFMIAGTGLGKWRLLVDGVPFTKLFSSTLPGDGALYRLNVVFPSRAHRTLTLQLSEGEFYGVSLGPDDSLYAPTLPKQPRCIVVGDSITVGQNNDSKLNTFRDLIGQALGWDVWDAGQGGTGFLNPGTLTGQTTFRQRLATDVIPWKPDIVIFAGGINDITPNNAAYTSAARQAELTALFAAMKAALPRCRVYVLGPWYTQGTGTTQSNAIDAVRNDLIATTTAAGLPFIDTQGWLVGTGYTEPTTVPTATASVSGGAVAGFTITNAGAGLTRAPLVNISGGGGYGATAHAVSGSGIVTSLVIDTPGSGYATAPTITLTNSGGSGNSSILISNDSTHRNYLGHEADARRIVAGILKFQAANNWAY